MPAVTVVHPRGETTRDVTDVTALNAYVINRGWTVQAGTYATAYQALTGLVYAPGGSTGIPAAPDTTRPAALANLDGGLAARATRPCRLAFAGSSTTAGTGATGVTTRWVDRFVGRVQNTYPSGGVETGVVASVTADFGALATAGGVHGYNLGEGGSTSATYFTADEITKVAALNPSAVFHMVGSNDYAAAIAPATVRANVTTVIAGLKAQIAGPCVHILLHSYQRFDNNAYAYPYADYAAALRDVAAADPANVVFFDVSPEFATLGVPGTDPLDLVNTDSTHPSDAGHALLADLVYRALFAGISQTTVVDLNRPLAADDFARADGPLTTATTGQAYILDGVWTVTGGRALWVSGNGHAVLDVGLQDVDVAADVVYDAAFTGTPAGGISVHYLDRNNRLAFYTQGLAIKLDKIASGTATNLWTGVPFTALAGTTHTLRAVSKGATVTLYVDGAQVGSYTLSAAEVTNYKPRTGYGIRGNNTLIRFDNLTIKRAA